jgi:hypothetical protein
MKCCLCNSEIKDYNGHPYIIFKEKTICTNCGLDLIPIIYKIDVGGLSHLLFKLCLESEFNRKHRKALPKEILNKLLHKYNFKCVLCGSKEKLSIDHIKPVSKGGTNDFSNLQILCKSCNSKKGNKWQQ